jgi:hypothetical protein
MIARDLLTHVFLVEVLIGFLAGAGTVTLLWTLGASW